VQGEIISPGTILSIYAPRPIDREAAEHSICVTSSNHLVPVKIQVQEYKAEFSTTGFSLYREHPLARRQGNAAHA